MKREKRYGWGQAAAVGIVANIASALPAGYNGDERFYERLHSPPGSPPGWLFAPAWAINNVLTLWSNLRVANAPVETPGRRRILLAEGATWVLFASFSALYFGLKSPVLGAVNTVAGLATTAIALPPTARIDRPAAWAIAPRLIWLAYATYVSVGTALRSPDEVFSRHSVSAGRAGAASTRRRRRRGAPSRRR